MTYEELFKVISEEILPDLDSAAVHLLIKRLSDAGLKVTRR